MIVTCLHFMLLFVYLLQYISANTEINHHHSSHFRGRKLSDTEKEKYLIQLFNDPILPTSSSKSLLFGGNGADEDERYQCPKPQSDEKKLNDFHVRGTNLGGWLVLEPWITPSIFYQFLGASDKWGDDAPSKVGFDSYTFCTALGDEEANRQLQQHWNTWVTEKEIKELADAGVDTLRIPIADWMFVEYEPFVGCWDGSIDQLNRVLDLMGKYNMKALLDVHCMRDSQNGLDNSGDTKYYRWLGTKSTLGAAVYQHWEIRGAAWLGNYDLESESYLDLNATNFFHGLKVIDTIIDMYKDNPVVWGIEPVNEPWDKTEWKVRNYTMTINFFLFIDIISHSRF